MKSFATTALVAASVSAGSEGDFGSSKCLVNLVGFAQYATKMGYSISDSIENCTTLAALGTSEANRVCAADIMNEVIEFGKVAEYGGKGMKYCLANEMAGCIQYAGKTWYRLFSNTQDIIEMTIVCNVDTSDAAACWDNTMQFAP